MRGVSTRGAPTPRPSGVRAPGLTAVPTRSGSIWSGYTWKVRLAKRENPRKNTWGDSTKNVRVQSDGSLRLGITTGRTWKSVELAGVRNLGYGRYRWVIDTDLSNRSNVVALFVRDMARPPPRMVNRTSSSPAGT